MALRNVWAVFLRDLGGYFLSPMAYIVFFVFALTHGVLFFFYVIVTAESPRQITEIIQSLFGFALFWVVPLSPLLTMRLIAEEKRTGTIEMLMTAPVTEWQVILGKFFAAQVCYTLIWLTLVPLLAILGIRGNPDWGPVLAIYIGIFSLGLLTNALGILASAGTRNQLIAAALSLTGNLLFVLVAMGPRLLPESSDVSRLFHYLSFTSHFARDYSRGVLDLRYIFFYVSFAALFLFFSVRVLEARKWR